MLTILDEFLDAVHDVVVPLVVPVHDIPCLEVPIRGKELLIQLRPVEVAAENIRPLEQQLTSISRT